MIENYHEITKQIKETESKHFHLKIPKCCQQLYAFFVHDHLIEFPRSNIEFETVTTPNFFKKCISNHKSKNTSTLFSHKR